MIKAMRNRAKLLEDRTNNISDKKPANAKTSGTQVLFFHANYFAYVLGG